MSEGGDAHVVSEVRERADELARLLDSFGDRLRRMRERNRQVEQEIVSFEADLERLRRRLEGRE